jgi:CheY-like chemotaxis protein
MEQYVMVSSWEPVALWNEGRRRARGRLGSTHNPPLPSEIMEPACPDGSSTLPDDVLIVEDDAIIALDFEDTILGSKALELIADRAPDFALLDVGLVHEKSFAVAERLDALKIPFVFVTGYGSAGAFPAAFAHTPTLPKPCSTEALQVLLKRRPNGGGGAAR